MTRALSSLCLLALGTLAAATAPSVLSPGPWIPLENALGRFASLDIDPGARRLLAAHVNDGTADFFDLETNKLLARVEVGPVVGIAVDSKMGRYFASVQDDKRVAIIDGATFKETGSIALPNETGAILFEARQRRIYLASDDTEVLWVVDPDAKKIVTSITVPIAPERLAEDASANRIYLIGGEMGKVCVIDTTNNTVVEVWPTAPAVHPRGLALEPARSRLFVAGVNGQLVGLDLKTGWVVATAAIAEHVDQIAFDAGLRRIYCAGPDWITVVQATNNTLATVGRVYTAATATNVAVDPKTHAVWSTFTDGEDGYARSWLPE